jgi:hypothetical protein
MIQGAETRIDGTTLVVRIPMRFQRHGGRKRIVAPDGREIVPNSKPQPDGTLVKALARAWRWQRMLDEGVYTSVSEIGDAESISKSYVSRILRLALLAPDLVEVILAGSKDQKTWSGRCQRVGRSSAGRSGVPARRPYGGNSRRSGDRLPRIPAYRRTPRSSSRTPRTPPRRQHRCACGTRSQVP